ncbi:MAG: HIT domain-containing protein [Candidatus Competibacteraceae bacterium]
MFALHPQLQADCIPLGRFPLCQLLLLNDSNYPWFILVPEREGISEIYQLSAEDRQQLMRESSHLAQRLAERFKAAKMNIAALGNVVPQLHLHHIVRYRHDPAWPAPVWGKIPATPYSGEAVVALKQTVAEILGIDFKLFA